MNEVQDGDTTGKDAYPMSRQRNSVVVVAA